MNIYPITPKVRALTGTKKRQFFLRTAETITPRGGWSGGSRDYYDGFNYKTNAPVTLQVGDYFSKPAESQPIPADSIVVVTGTFCGKPAYPAIYCRPEELETVKKFLEMP